MQVKDFSDPRGSENIVVLLRQMKDSFGAYR